MDLLRARMYSLKQGLWRIQRSVFEGSGSLGPASSLG